MNIWQKLFGTKQPATLHLTGPLDWMQLPPISAIALLDPDAFSRAPAILHGLLGLRNLLMEVAQTVFPDDTPDTLKQLIAMKCQFLAPIDTSAGLARNRLPSVIQSFCSENGFDLIDSDSEGFGISALYSSALSEAWGVFHVIADANLTKEHWRSLVAKVPTQIDTPARMALGKSADGRYVVAVFQRDMVSGHDLVSRDAGTSFHDFCAGAVGRMKRERIPYDILSLGAGSRAKLEQMTMRHTSPNKIIGASAGGPRQLAIQTRWAACVAQFGR